MSQNITKKIADFFTTYPLRVFDKQQLIIRAGEMPAHAFYIVEGRVSQYDIAPTGKEVVVNVFKPGAFFPMSAAINATPNQYFFEASTKTVVHVAPATEAVQFLRDNPDVAFDLLSRVYRGVDGVLRRQAHLMGGDAKTRLLFELLNAAQRFGEQQPDGSILISLKEGDLARHSGLTRETVNRDIQDLKAKGAVQVGRHNITVTSIDQLEKLLGDGL